MTARKPQPWYDGDDPIPWCGNQCPHWAMGQGGAWLCMVDADHVGTVCTPRVRADYAELLQLRTKGSKR